eukprot:CAMPEP_0184504236 /NCGR_PEP_ID=MMETSP0113_2-20130426/52355_1 /TAXON_ID=91329 /ORGANISM="Norrisiella sphaerica, Strain BC52" /LENGTH=472 /DNA_ID=CAMNT_0026893861 /DNA_START=90 /DNA_END=1508 /DNA_ORIENTATION=+
MGTKRLTTLILLVALSLVLVSQIVEPSVFQFQNYGSLTYVEHSQDEVLEIGDVRPKSVDELSESMVEINSYGHSGTRMTYGMMSCISNAICHNHTTFLGRVDLRAHENFTSEDSLCHVNVDWWRHGALFPVDWQIHWSILHRMQRITSFMSLSCQHGLLALGGKIESAPYTFLEQRTKMNCRAQTRLLIPTLRECIRDQLTTSATKQSVNQDSFSINYTKCIPDEWTQENRNGYPPIRLLLALRNPIDVLISLNVMIQPPNLRHPLILQQIAMLIFRFVLYHRLHALGQFELVVSDYEAALQNPTKHWASTYRRLVPHAGMLLTRGQGNQILAKQVLEGVTAQCAKRFSPPAGSRPDRKRRNKVNWRIRQPRDTMIDEVINATWKLLPAEPRERKALEDKWGIWLLPEEIMEKKVAFNGSSNVVGDLHGDANEWRHWKEEAERKQRELSRLTLSREDLSTMVNFDTEIETFR